MPTESISVGIPVFCHIQRENIYMVASSCVVPVLFLISAKSVKNSSEG